MFLRVLNAKTINALVPWPKIAPILGLPCRDDAYPARTRCPFCGGNLHVYEDNISNGQWHYCFDCRRSGDLIELAAGVWKISLEAAVRKLVNLGFPLVEDEEVKPIHNLTRMLQHRQLVNKLWSSAKTYLTNCSSDSLTSLRRQYRLTTTIDADRWRNGPGEFLGAYPARKIEETLTPNSKHENARDVSETSRIFRGPNWKDVLIAPFYSSPDRICGFQFTGRQGRKDDRLFVRMPRFGRSTEGGLFGLHTLTVQQPFFKEYAFVVNDPMLAMRLQLRHFHTHNTPLPLVSWMDDDKVRTANAWGALEHRTPVFWSWTLDASLVYQAMLVNGMISWIQLESHTQERIDHYIRLRGPSDLLRGSLRKARPWLQALQFWAHRQPVEVVEELLLNLETYGVDVQYLAKEMSHPVIHRLEKIRCRSVQYNGYTIVERGDGWAVADKKKPLMSITDMIVRVDRIMPGRPPLYEGRILYNDSVVPFSLALAGKDRGHLFHVLADICTEAGVGRPILTSSKHGPLLFEIAALFQRPQFLAVVQS